MTKTIKKIIIKKLTLGILPLFIVFQLVAKDNCLDPAYVISGEKDTIRKTIPYTLPWDDMPIDLSFIYADEKPAGKHGFLTINEGRFVFEDNTEARFWGTCFNSVQNFPSHEHSEKVAKRLAKIGVNLVRFHQLDGEWSTPNIFQFTKGENKADTQSFDPESMDRLDYLIHCLKQEGIYVYMDLLTYRRFKTGDGVHLAHEMGHGARPYSTYNRTLIELQKKFNHDLWSHFNPYTKLPYKDDPAIVLAEVINEADLWSQKVTLEPYRAELETLYREWADNKKIKLGREKVEFDKKDTLIQKFFIDVTSDYYREMIGHMREMGVRVPLAGTNWTINAAHLMAQAAGDFTDTHTYFYDFRLWKDGSKHFSNASMTGSTDNMIPRLAFYKVQGKPFFVSEWDNTWPNEWRAESSVLMAAIGAFQGWGGLAIHTYRYTLDENVDMIAKPVTADAMAGIYYRGGSFDTFNDPAKFGLFYHAALIFRRGDVKPAEKTIGIKPAGLSSNFRQMKKLIAEKHRVETVLPGMDAKEEEILETSDSNLTTDEVEVWSDTGELYRNLDKKIGWVDTPMTKTVYGFVGSEKEIKLNQYKISVKTDFATVAISSLTDNPISGSDNMLLTAVGRAENSGIIYNKEHNQVLNNGHGPILIDVVEATIEIETDKSNLRVMSINPQGVITGYMPSEYKDGVFKFEIGKEFQSMYYLIQSL